MAGGHARRMRKADRLYRPLRAALTELFAEWDPLGVYADDGRPLPVEYDFMAEMMVIALRSDATGDTLLEVIDVVLPNGYRVPDVQPPPGLTDRIDELWRALRPAKEPWERW